MKYLIIVLNFIFLISCSNNEIKILNENQVEIRNSILYEKNETLSFTGKVISKYENNQLKKEISYKNGELDGIKYYYPNGQIKEEVNFKKGKIKSSKSYKENGAIESSYFGDNRFIETFSTGILYIFMPFLN